MKFIFLKENYLKMSQKELAKKFDRTVVSVAQKAGKLGLKNPTKREIYIQRLILTCLPYLH